MAITFDSTTDRVAFTSSIAFPLTGSLAFWFKPTWAQNDGVEHNLFQMMENTNPALFQLVKVGDNSLYMGWYWGGVGDFRLVVPTASYTIIQNAWNHLAVTWDDAANVTRAYLNGALIGTPTSVLQAFGSNRTRYIGNADPAITSTNAAADIAEFAVWNEVLTAAEITSGFRGFAPPLIRPTALVDYLPLLRDAINLKNPAPTFTNVAVAPHCRIIYQRGERQFPPLPMAVPFAPTVAGSSSVTITRVLSTPLFAPSVAGAATVTAAITTPAAPVLFAPAVAGSSSISGRLHSGPPQTLVIQASPITGDDAVANHALPTTNNGSSTGLALGGASSADPAYAHLRMPLAPTLATDGAYAGILSIYTAATAAADRDYECWVSDPINAGWTETGLTWNTRDGSNPWAGGANGGGVVGVDIGWVAVGTAHYNANDPADTELQFILTPSALAAALGGTLDLVIKRIGTTTATSPTLRSIDTAIAGSRPKLTIQYLNLAVYLGVVVGGSSSVTAELTTPAQLAVTIAGAATVTAAIESPAQLAATVAGSSQISCELGSIPLLDPQVAAASSVAVTISSPAVPQFAPAIQAASSVAVGLGSPALLDPAVAGATAIQAAIQTRPLLSPAIAGVSVVTASLASIPLLAVQIQGSTLIDTSLGGPAMLAPSVRGVSSFDVQLGSRPLLVAAVAGVSQVTAAVTAPQRALFAPQIAGASSVTAAVSAPLVVFLAVQIAGVSTVQAAIQSPALLVPQIVSDTLILAGLATPARFAPAIVGTSIISASIGIGIPPIYVAHPLAGLLLETGRRGGQLLVSGRQAGLVLDDGRRAGRIRE